MRLSIGDLSATTGETVKTLRYWTDQGLLNTERGENNYRYYMPDMTQRAAFIRSTQALGFTLEDIKSILSRLLRVRFSSANLFARRFSSSATFFE